MLKAGAASTGLPGNDRFPAPAAAARRPRGPGWALIAFTLIVAGCGEPAAPTLPDNNAIVEGLLSDSREPGPRESSYEGANGAELGFKAYLAPRASSELALVYLHGIESHADWFDRAARLLQEKGFDVFCLDRRGSGINRENRGLPSGHAESMEQLLIDVDAFMQPLGMHYERIVLVGLSWGGKLALGYALEHPDTADGLILITPGLATLVDVSAWTKLGILVTSRLAPRTQFAVPIEPPMFTTTPSHLSYIRSDPLRLTAASAGFFMTSRALDRYVERGIPGNRLPVLLFLAGRDRIIDNDGVLAMLRRSKGAELEVRDYPEQTHSIQFDAPGQMTGDIDRWIDQRILTGGAHP